jgi:uncharacterized protein YndB with AHSA1/START domain
MRIVSRTVSVLLAVAGVAVISVITVMAFMRRDHKVELEITYSHTTPDTVWRQLTDHAAEPDWLPAFGMVIREADIGGHEVWTHSSPDRSFNFTMMTITTIPPRRYERILLRDNQPRNQAWDGRWIFDLERIGSGTRLRVAEFGWTDGFPFFIRQRVLGDPDTFLKYYATMIGRRLNDPAQIQVVRSR